MSILEEKINIILSYIATDDEVERKKIQAMAAEAVKDPDNTPEPLDPKTIIQNPIDVEELILEHLRNMGVPAHLVGHDYVMTAIKLGLTNSEYMKQVTGVLYPDIASQYNTTPTRVERAIRHAVEVAFNRGDWNYIVATFGNTTNANKGKLTNSEFIAGSVRMIRSQMKRFYGK
jgi:two-component system response regulator (stage 0 sporulation protein A)